MGCAVFAPSRRGYDGADGEPLRVALERAPEQTPERGRLLVERLLAENDDVLAALAFLLEQPWIAADRIICAGLPVRRHHDHAGALTDAPVRGRRQLRLGCHRLGRTTRPCARCLLARTAADYRPDHDPPGRGTMTASHRPPRSPPRRRERHPACGAVHPPGRAGACRWASSSVRWPSDLGTGVWSFCTRRGVIAGLSRTHRQAAGRRQRLRRPSARSGEAAPAAVPNRLQVGVAARTARSASQAARSGTSSSQMTSGTRLRAPSITSVRPTGTPSRARRTSAARRVSRTPAAGRVPRNRFICTTIIGRRPPGTSVSGRPRGPSRSGPVQGACRG